MIPQQDSNKTVPVRHVLYLDIPGKFPEVRYRCPLPAHILKLLLRVKLDRQILACLILRGLVHISAGHIYRMHATAAYFFSKFVLAYLVPYQELHGHIRVLDIGAYDVNGNMGNVLNIMKTDSFPSLNHTYVGLDLSAGPNVDVVATNPWEWPMLTDASFDLVVSSSAFEHDALFWLTIKEMARVLKPEGLIWLSAPAAGPYHAFPRDYWRFYEDSWSALPLWEPRLRLLESGVDRAKPHNSWDDSMAVFERVPEHEVSKASLFERWQNYNL